MPIIQPVEPHRWFQRRRWVVVARWRFPLLIHNVKIEIPAGFEFDGASIPRPLTWLFSPVGILLIAALIHDWGYRNKFAWIIPSVGDDPEQWWDDKPRAFWDDLFYRVAIQMYSMDEVFWLPWFAIRAFGWLVWRKERV